MHLIVYLHLLSIWIFEFLLTDSHSVLNKTMIHEFYLGSLPVSIFHDFTDEKYKLGIKGSVKWMKMLKWLE